QYDEFLLPIRKKIALRYCNSFKLFNWFISPALKNKDRESSYHLFPLRIKNITESDRDQIIDYLQSKGVITNVHFIPMPMLTYFKSIGYHIEDYPNSYKQYACEISLPIYPQLSKEEVDYIIVTVIDAVRYQKNKEKVLEKAS